MGLRRLLALTAVVPLAVIAPVPTQTASASCVGPSLTIGTDPADVPAGESSTRVRWTVDLPAEVSAGGARLVAGDAVAVTIEADPSEPDPNEPEPQQP